jgi:basic membrane lipoprotein Med (substrate-binding protein (PBP1-ABC) superfamily)
MNPKPCVNGLGMPDERRERREWRVRRRARSSVRRSWLALLFIAVIGSFLIGSPAVAAPKKLKVAAMLGTPVEEHWVSRLHLALVAARDRGEIDYVVSEDVKNPDMIRVLQQYAEQKVDLIVGEVYPVEREARRLAKQYPNVMFLMGSSMPPQAPNFAVFDNWNQDAAYLAGLIAGSMTKTNTLGAVGGMAIPEVNRLVGAFKQGACEVNPKVKLLVSYIGSWYDVPKDKEAAMAQIAGGADIVYAERYGAALAAKDQKKLAIANLVDLVKMQPEYKDVVITSTLWYADAFINTAIKHVQSGTFKPIDYGQVFGLMKDGGAGLAGLGAFEGKLPADLVAKLKAREVEIKAGKFKATIVSNEVKTGPCP